jgi:hypothetical protein
MAYGIKKPKPKGKGKGTKKNHVCMTHEMGGRPVNPVEAAAFGIG